MIKDLSKKAKESASVIYCKRCERVRAPAGYVNETEESLATILAKALCGGKCKVKVILFDDKSATVNLTYNVNGDDVTFKKVVALKMEHQICISCYRKSSGYYEAIVQLRGDPFRVEKMKLKFEKFIGSRSGFISKIENEDFGTDIYVSDKFLAKAFFGFYKLAPKVSYTLYSVKNGKRIYRNTYHLLLE